MRLTVEVEGRGEAPPIPGDGEVLVTFMSFAAMRGFGAQHPLIALAERLQRVHGLSLGPLTTFYETTAEDEEDERKLELAWQEPGQLRETAARLATILTDDRESQALVRRANAEGLAEQAAALASIAEEAKGAGARVRLTYSL